MKGEEERISELRSCVKSGGGRPGLLVPYKPYGFCGRKSTMKEEEERQSFRAQELCRSRGCRPGLPVSNSRYGLCGRKATLN